ncbi:zinc finger Y-chromosomal protein isoform X1 [Halyomorpha halys]|uniref:zinc finger Y-chromosomal protein isoform X1 n=1 Tax=Halyomorpha halys TaxID=286706 RepID=UPI0006D51824|nr:zinc finger Y-chromosomal protein isoform X1 [Halyomorpha halys]
MVVMESEGDSLVTFKMNKPDPLFIRSDEKINVPMNPELLDPLRLSSSETSSDGIVVKREKLNTSPKRELPEIYIKQEPVEEDNCDQVFSDEDVKYSLEYEEPPACEVIIKQELEKDESLSGGNEDSQNYPLDLGIPKQKSLDLQSKPKIFKCPCCVYTSDTSLKLKSHTLHRHSKEKPHRCPHCHYATVTSTDLKRHIMSIHSKEKPHRCPHCEYGAVSVFNLKTHVMAQHTKEKPHHCPHCDYTAVTGTTLKRHIMSIHTEEKPHQCPHCKYATVHAGALKRHVMSVHFNEKPLQCPYCNYGSVFSHHIKRHVKRRHTKEPEKQTTT